MEQFASENPLLTAFVAVVGVAILLPLTLVIVRRLMWWVFAFEPRIAKSHREQKSTQVRTGQIAETIAPLLQRFPVVVGKQGTSTVFLGQPIDYVHFDPAEGITFIEVKSGRSKLSRSQRQLRDLVRKGKVRWREVRVD